MRQLVQSVRDGKLKIVEFPTPHPGPTEVLVATRRSLISSGTESAVRALASASLVQKAKARPDLVRQVLDKAKSDGIKSTMRAVRTKFEDDMPLGYSAMGIAVEVGEAVEGIQPGDRVATASAGHGDYQLVPGLLVAKVPDGVNDVSAAFTTVGAIALHGLRQAALGVDARIAVVGLGLLGQLTTRLALASGLQVVGIDLQQPLVQRATQAGAAAFVESGADTTRAIWELTDRNGVDAVLITAATSSSEPITRATEILRDRGTIVVVGDVGLELDRRPFYEKELELRFARSYGPGRYDRSYEDYAVDYPAGYVRWTEGRNMQAVLSLMSRGRLEVDDLATSTYSLDRAEQAYSALHSNSPDLGVQFTYDSPVTSTMVSNATSVDLLTDQPKASSGAGSRDLRSGIIGAGQFAKATLLPALQAAGWPRPSAISSASGLSAQSLSDKYQIATVSPDSKSLIDDPSVSVVFVLSRHDSHAELIEQSLLAGKDVFVEKPLALSEGELDQVLAAQRQSGRLLWTGFNRRYASAVVQAKGVLGATKGPLVATYRVNAGWLPEAHWYKDRRQGGRLLGEACHFVDTISWIVGCPPSRIIAFGDGHGEALLQEDLTIAMQFPEGSSASISYAAAGNPKTPKERLEILGRGRTVVIDDYKSIAVDGKDQPIRPADKGHVANLIAFRSALQSPRDGNEDMQAAFATTAAMLAAARSLSNGCVQKLL